MEFGFDGGCRYMVVGEDQVARPGALLIECPFCGFVFWASRRDLSGVGYGCPGCNASHSRDGCAYPAFTGCSYG